MRTASCFSPDGPWVSVAGTHVAGHADGGLEPAQTRQPPDASWAGLSKSLAQKHRLESLCDPGRQGRCPLSRPPVFQLTETSPLRNSTFRTEPRRCGLRFVGIGGQAGPSCRWQAQGATPPSEQAGPQRPGLARLLSEQSVVFLFSFTRISSFSLHIFLMTTFFFFF